MKIIKLNENRINHSDLWIIGGTSMLGISTGLLMLEKLNAAIIGFLVVGIGFGLVISSIFSKKQTEKQ
jgi:uncharacterized membrane protein